MDSQKKLPACGKLEKSIEWGNSKGIKAPSKTSESLMNSEGYVAEAASPENPEMNTDKSMSHVDEGVRVIPTQHEWPL